MSVQGVTTMTNTELLEMINQLSQADKDAIEGIVERLIVAHDPDYTQLTPQEKKNLQQAENENKLISHEELKKELGL